MPLDAYVRQDDEWVAVKGMDHAEIKAAKNGSKDYAEFTGDSQLGRDSNVDIISCMYGFHCKVLTTLQPCMWSCGGMCWSLKAQYMVFDPYLKHCIASPLVISSQSSASP